MEYTEPMDPWEKALIWHGEGKSIGALRKLLSELNLSTEEVNAIISAIDDLRAKSLKLKEEKKQAITKMSIGALLSIAGIVLTLILHSKKPLQGLMYIYTFGPMVVGYVIFKMAFSKHKKLKEEEASNEALYFAKKKE